MGNQRPRVQVEFETEREKDEWIAFAKTLDNSASAVVGRFAKDRRNLFEAGWFLGDQRTAFVLAEVLRRRAVRDLVDVLVEYPDEHLEDLKIAMKEAIRKIKGADRGRAKR